VPPARRLAAARREATPLPEQAMLSADNIPAPSFDNLYLADPLADHLWNFWLGKEAFQAARPHFISMGERGARAQPLSARADREGPRLVTHSPRGERVDRVEYHPDYLALEELAFGGGIVAIKYEQAFLKKHRARRHLVGFGAGYYFAQNEIGLYCPLCMTDGVGRVLERHAKGEPAEETRRRLAARDRAELWQGAMFLTEKQGGSDVGANAVTAREEGGRGLLCGDKWFCSNVDAEAILALARMPDGPAGTRGLGLFLVLRHRPEGNAATIRIHRLKDKLGVRSMASGEVTLEETEGFLIGGVGEGFKQMAEMLNLSRLYNAVASLAGMRRAILEALAYGAERRAFGKRLWDLSLWRAGMADLTAEHLGALLLGFEAVRALDAGDGGDEQARTLVRLLIPMAKALTGKLAVFGVSEAMEAIGGNAYIEESILPRLLRDTQVLPIWEGTTNILALDAMRAIHKERSHEAFFARTARALAAAKANGADAQARAALEARVAALGERLKALAAQPQEMQERGAREWMESAGRAMTLALLLETAAHPPLKDACLAAFRRLSTRPFGTMPLSSAHAVELADSEEPLLRAGYAGG
jgi:alkylation response protein AidB-like acyl-CoA dehydrogenase